LPGEETNGPDGQDDNNDDDGRHRNPPPLELPADTRVIVLRTRGNLNREITRLRHRVFNKSMA